MQEHDDTSSPVMQRDSQGNLHMDDINIPLVAVSVVFFGILLAVTIVGLQATFSHFQAAERQSKILPRDYAGDATHPGTELGMLWKKQRAELYDPNNVNIKYLRVPATTAASQPDIHHMTIDEAIQQIAKEGE